MLPKSGFLLHCASRFPAGTYGDGLLTALRAFGRHPDALTGKIALYWLHAYFLGRHYCETRNRYLFHITGALKEPKPLYHFFYTDTYDSIQNSGIHKPGCHIFLASEINYAASYYAWKDSKAPGPRQYAIAILDTARILRDGIPVFAIDRQNQFVAISIPFRYINEVLSPEECMKLIGRSSVDRV